MIGIHQCRIQAGNYSFILRKTKTNRIFCWIPHHKAHICFHDDRERELRSHQHNSHHLKGTTSNRIYVQNRDFPFKVI